MSQYQELLKQRDLLEQKIQEARKQELSHAITQVRELVSQFGLTDNDVFGHKRGVSVSRVKVAPKFRNPATGETWTGRGKPPRWIADQDREQFRIAA